MSVKSITASLVLTLSLTTILAAQVAEKESLTISGARIASPAEVTFFKSDRVINAFKKGDVLVNKGNYQVHASHRDVNGMAEVHTEDTDIIYILEGSATFVTGGTVVDPKTVAPGEIRGASVRNGDTRTLSKGDVIIVPNGTPHWFEKVSGPLNYFAVKVRRPQSDGRTQ